MEGQAPAGGKFIQPRHLGGDHLGIRRLNRIEECDKGCFDLSFHRAIHFFKGILPEL